MQTRALTRYSCGVEKAFVVIMEDKINSHRLELQLQRKLSTQSVSRLGQPV